MTTEQRTGIAYYTARIAIGPDELARLGDVRLVPACLSKRRSRRPTGRLVAYLTKPLIDQIARAFRER